MYKKRSLPPAAFHENETPFLLGDRRAKITRRIYARGNYALVAITHSWQLRTRRKCGVSGYRDAQILRSSSNSVANRCRKGLSGRSSSSNSSARSKVSVERSPPLNNNPKLRWTSDSVSKTTSWLNSNEVGVSHGSILLPQRIDARHDLLPNARISNIQSYFATAVEASAGWLSTIFRYSSARASTVFRICTSVCSDVIKKRSLAFSSSTAG